MPRHEWPAAPQSGVVAVGGGDAEAHLASQFAILTLDRPFGVSDKAERGGAFNQIQIANPQEQTHEGPIRNTTAGVVPGLAALTARAANVLVVLSDEAQLQLRDKRSFDTGFYANELMQPVKKLLDAGHTVTFATPLGKRPRWTVIPLTRCIR
jgi:hypothetical protein